ncbi:MAG: Fe-S cluster assembly protein SufD [Candidatus Sericytochromatia bacterium]|nr:Fe-S cluster assembly protein SufD [Candidatus Sericytochromatia bacterium]
MATTTSRESWLGNVLAQAPALEGTGPLARLRQQADQILRHAALPSPRDEAWRFTSLAPLTAHEYSRVQAPGQVEHSEVARYLWPEAEGCRLTFVDGHYAAHLSSREPGASLTVRAFSELDGEEWAAMLGRVAPTDGDVMAALAARHCRDGALVRIPADWCEERPIHLLFISTGLPIPSLIAPRVLVVAESGCRATLVQAYVALQETVQAVHAVTEVLVERNARLHHLRVQSESRLATHLETWAARLAPSAHYTLKHITLGGRLSRLDVTIDGQGNEIDAHLDGLALLSGDQVADVHSRLIHAFPHGRSRQTQRMILDERSHAIFAGMIKVLPGAVQTDSAQSSRGLLLSPHARLDTKPELAIEADDVKCAHGAAIGQLDADQLFYLRARGISETESRALLTYAFASEVLEGVAIPTLRTQLQAVMLGRTTAPRPRLTP